MHEGEDYAIYDQGRRPIKTADGSIPQDIAALEVTACDFILFIIEGL